MGFPVLLHPIARYFYSLTQQAQRPAHLLREQTFARFYRLASPRIVIIKTVIAHNSANRRRAECQCRACMSTTEARTEGAASAMPNSFEHCRVASEEGDSQHYRGANRWSSERRMKFASIIPSRDRGRQSQGGRPQVNLQITRQSG